MDFINLRLPLLLVSALGEIFLRYVKKCENNVFPDILLAILLPALDRPASVEGS